MLESIKIKRLQGVKPKISNHRRNLSMFDISLKAIKKKSQNDANTGFSIYDIKNKQNKS